MARFLASLTSHFYAAALDGSPSSYTVRVKPISALERVKITPETQYPCEGLVKLTLSPASTKRFRQDLRS